MFKFEKDTIDRYVKSLREKSVTPNEIKRKLQSIKKFLDWTVTTGHLDQNDFKQMEVEIANAVAGDSPVIPTKVGIHNRNYIDPVSEHGMTIDNTIGIRNYIAFAVVLLLISLIGFGLYNQFFKKTATPFAYPTALTPGSRIISFQGRLTDSIGNPIIAPIDLTYKFYTVSTGGSPITGSTRVCTASPDQDGVFANLIGSDPGPSCTPELPATIFSENPQVWLGVTVGSELTEMSPRQQIANVGYAMNAETLQGFPPGTTVSTIPFISTQGDLLIAAATPGIRSTYTTANFVISSAKTTTIQSANAGDIVLSATDGGALRFNTYNGSLVERITVLSGGNVGISNVNPLAALDVIGSASLSANLAFSGATTQIGQLNGGNISFATSPGGDAGLVTKMTLTNLGNVGIGSTLPAYLFDVSGGSGIVGQFSGRVIGGNAVNNNEFATLGQIAAGAGQYWQRTNGALSPTTLADDVLLGATSTSSAKFAFMNVNTGTPTASISGNLAIASPTGANPATSYDIFNGGSFNLRTSPGGDAGLASRLFVNNAGNVGIGSAVPSAQLDILGTSSGTIPSVKITSGYLDIPTGLKLPSTTISNDLLLHLPFNYSTASTRGNYDYFLRTDTTNGTTASYTTDSGWITHNNIYNNLPRFEKTNIGHGVWIENGRRNLMQYQSFENGGSITGWTNSGLETFTTTTSYRKHQSYAASLADTNATGGQAYQSYTLTSGQSYPFFCYALNATSGSLRGVVDSSVVQLWGGGDLTTTYTPVEGGWYKIEGTISGTGGAVNYGVDVKASKAIYLDGCQIEANYGTTNGVPYGTTMIYNDSTNQRNRGEESLYYYVWRGLFGYDSTDTILEADKGTISFWFKPEWGATQPTSDMYFLQLYDSSTEKVMRIFYQASDDKIYAQMYNGSNFTTVSVASAAQTFAANTNHFLSFRWDNTAGTTLNIDGVETSYSGSWTAQTQQINTSTLLYLGSKGTTGGRIDALISDFAIFDRSFTADEVAQIYNGKAPIEDYSRSDIVMLQQGPNQRFYQNGSLRVTGEVYGGSINTGTVSTTYLASSYFGVNNAANYSAHTVLHLPFQNTIEGSRKEVGTYTRNDPTWGSASAGDETSLKLVSKNPNEPRIDRGFISNAYYYDTSYNTGNFGVHIEEARNNVVPYSSFEAGNPPTGWTAQANCTAAQSNLKAMHGTYSANITTTGVCRYYQPINFTGAAVQHQISAYVWRNETNSWGATIDSTIAGLYAATDLASGALSTTYTPLGNGWYRLTGQFTATAANWNVGVYMPSTGRNVYVDAIQVERTAAGTVTYFPTTYIPTDTVIATRAAETLTYPIPASFKSEKGGVSFWFKPQWSRNITSDNGNKYLFYIPNVVRVSLDGTNDRMQIEHYNGASWTSVLNTSTTAVNQYTWNHFACGWYFNYNYCRLNGTAYSSGTSWTPQSPAGQLLYIGSDNAGANQANAQIAAFTLFDTYLDGGQQYQLYLNRGKMDDYYRTDLAKLNDSTTTATQEGSLYLTGLYRSGLGTAALPSYSFYQDTNTGLFGAGGDVLGFSTAGTEQMRIDASGNVGISSTSPTSFKLEVAGNIGPDGNNTRDLGSSSRYYNTIYANNIVGVGALGYWQRGTGVLFPNTLTDGLAATTSATTVATFTSTGSNNALLAGGASNNLTVGPTGSLTFNAVTNDIVTGTDEHLSLMPNGAGNVGISTTTPTAKLDIAGDASTSGHLVFRGATPNYLHVLNGTDLRISTSPGGDAGNTDRLTLLANGNVGVGTTAPASKLDVAGDIRISLGDADLILNNGDVSQVNRVTINDTGSTEGFCFDTDCTPGIAVYTVAQGGYNGFVFDTDSGYPYIFNTGNVGIGSTSPTSFKLEVAGNIGPEADNTRDLGSSSKYYANIYANNIVGSGALGYWKRGVGTLYPNVTSDAIAATSSGTTVATFTATGTNNALRAGGNTNYATLSSNGNLTFTNAGVATITGPTSGLTIDATTGALNFGTSANARTITIGNITTTTGVNVNTGTAGTTYTTTNGIFTLNTGTGTISLGTDAVAKTITIGNATTTTGLALNSGTGDIVLTSTDQVKLNSSKAAGGTTTEALSLKSTVDLGVADELLQIGDSGADFVTVRGDGNVGIGSATPSSFKLEVAGNIGPEADNTRDLGSSSKYYANIYANNIVGSGALGYWKRGVGTLYPNVTSDAIAATSSGTTVATFTSSGANDALRTGGASNYLTVGSTGSLTFNAVTNDIVTGSNEHLALMPNGTGNVGVGSSSPGYKLDVNGVINTNNSLRVDSSGGGYGVMNLGSSGIYTSRSDGLYLQYGQTSGSIHIQPTSGGTASIDFGDTVAGQDTNLYRSVANTLRTNDSLIVDNNIGIGSTSPTAKLDIAGDASTSGHLVFRGTTPNYLHVLNGTDLRISTSPGGDAGNTDRLTLLANGNVGVGTTAPGGKLDVNGKLSVTGAYAATTGQNGLHFGFSSNIGSILAIQEGTAWRNLQIDGANILLQTSSTGNVGISSATPTSFKLEVAGNIGPDANATRDIGSSARHYNTIYADNVVGIGALGYWSRGTGVLFPATTTDGVAATTSATTVATFTATGTNDALRTGGSANYITISSNGDLSFTGANADAINKVSGTLNINTVNNQAITTGTGQVTLAGNVDATNGLDVTTANLSVGGANFTVAPGTGNITTAGTLTLPNSNTVTGVASYAQFANGISVGGGTTYRMSNTGVIAANTTGTINSLNINAGAISGSTGYSQTSGNFDFSSAGTFAIASSGMDVTTLGAVSNVTTLGMSSTLTNSAAATTAITLSGTGAGLTFTGAAANANSINTSNNNHLLLVPGTGNVGISSATPTSFKLEVAGNIGPDGDNTRDLGSSSRYYANIYANNIVGSGALGYWKRGVGTLYPNVTSDAIAATSSGTTVATFTATGTNNALRAGGNTNYATLSSNGNLAFTNSGIATITGPTSGLTIDATTGALNFGTSANARTITIGNVTTTTGVNINTGTAGTTYTTTNGTFALNTGTGAINLGTDAVAKTITMGNGTGATSVVLNTGTGALNLGTNAVAHTVTIGNVTGTTGVNVNTGTAGTTYTTTNGIFTLNTGTGTISLGTDAVAKTITIGNATTTTALALNSGTGDIVLTSTDQVKLNSSKAAGGTTTEALSLKSTVDLGVADELLQIGDSGADFLTILGNGNVGIGTALPSSLAHLYSTSTSTSFTGFNLDWSPGSSTTTTGDLFALNIGTNGTASTLFNVKDTGSSLFSVSETAVTSNLPTSFTSAGDVSIAYDLLFTNPTSSYIKSSAPLYIQAGEVFGSSDLTLKTYNSGDVVLDAAGGVTLSQAQPWSLATSTTALNIQSGLLNLDTTNTRVGIGTTAPTEILDVVGNASASGNITLGQTGALRSQYGPLNLAYKSALNAWTNGLTLQDTTGNVGIGSANPGAFKLEVAGNIGPEADNTRNLGSASRYFNTIYVNNIVGSGALGYWNRGVGVLYPATLTDGIAATTSATTVATFTATGSNNALRAGGNTNYATLSSNGNLTFTNAGIATITGPTTGLTIDATTGALNFGTSANARVITIGNVTGTTAVNVNTGTAGTTYTTTNGIFTLNTGTGTISLGTDAVAKTITIGNATTTTGLALNSGTGDITLTSTDQVKLNSSKAAGGTTTEALSLKSTVDLGVADEVLQIGDSGADFMTVLGNGNVGIGSALPGYRLDVSGTGRITSTLNVDSIANPGLTVGNGTTGYFKVGGSTISDAAGNLNLDSDSGYLSTPDAFTLTGTDNSDIIYGATISTGTETSGIQNAVGHIDNQLVRANEKYTVTMNNGCDVGSTTEMFDGKGDSTCQITDAAPNEIITINFGSIRHYFYAFRMTFPYSRYTSSVQIEKYYDTNSGNGWDSNCDNSEGDLAWTNIYSNASYASSDLNVNSSLGNGICQFRVTLSGTPNIANNTWVGEIMAHQFFYGPAGDLYVHATGDTIYGALQIGTATTNRNLTVQGDLAVNGATSADITSTTTTASLFNTTATTLNIGGASTTTGLGAASGTITLGSNSTINGGAAANDDVTIQGTSNGTRTTSYVNLQPNGGNVGIGTTVPGNKLSVEGVADIGTLASTYIRINSTPTGAAGGRISVGSNLTNDNLVLNAKGTGGILTNYDAGTGGVGFYGGSTTRVAQLDSSGKLYLGGTASPTNVLDVNGAAAIGYAGTAAPASGLIVSGNVGIGTTAPTAKLDVRGDATFSGTLSIAPMFIAAAGTCNISSTGKIYYDATLNRHYYCNGTSWTAMGGGTVSGSGTLNYVAKWTPDGSTLGNSVIYDTGTNVGIGTTVPVAKLDTRGQVASQSWLNLWNTGAVGSLAGGDARPAVTFGATDTAQGWFVGPITSTTAALTTMGIYHWSGGQWTQSWNVNGGSAIGGAGYADGGVTPPANGLIVAGNVGIGTTSPETKLDVSGNIHIKSGYIDMDRNNTTATGISWYNTPGGYTAWQDYMAPAGVSQGVTGTVTAPSGTLVTSWAKRSFIEDAANYGWTFESGTSSSTTPTVKFEIKSSDGSFHSYGSGFIDGNVGIGTTSSSSRLHIADSGFTGSTLFNIIADDEGPWALNFRQDTAAQDWGIFVDNADRLRIYDRTDSRDVLTLDGTGNVGIGTTGPVSKLQVAGEIRAYNGGATGWVGMVPGAAGYSGYLQWYRPDSSTRIAYLGYSDGGVNNLGLNLENSASFNINGGNVGIGTTSPGYKLQVTGGSGVGTSIYTDGYVQDVSGVTHGNYVSSHSWADTGTGSVGIFNQNGQTSENSREWGIGPHGNRTILWKGGNDVDSNGDGGWDTSGFTIDNTKSYRASVWIKKTNSTDGTTYFGISGSNVTDLLGTAETNPYFFCGDLPVLDRWYLLVGYIHGSGDSSTTAYGGIYDGTTGKKVQSFTNTTNCNSEFKFTVSATTQSHRSYLYYDTTLADRQYWWDPRFEEVNGKEQTIESLAGLYKGATQDAVSYFGGNIGIGTTSPTNMLDLYSSAGDAAIEFDTNSNIWSVGGKQSDDKFYISRSATVGTNHAFVIDTSNNIGIGTTAPGSKLHAYLGANEIARFNDGTNASGATFQNGSLLSQSSQFQIAATSTNPLSFYTGATINSMTAGTERMRIATNGNVGIGGGLATGAQLDLNGGTIISAMLCGNLAQCWLTGGSPGVDDRYVVPNGNTRIDTLEIVSDLANNAGYISFLNVDTAAKVASISANKTSGTVTIDNTVTNITDVGYPTVPDLCVGDPYWCTGKVDAGTIDPPYTINGKKYATFLSAMTGVKEETTGFVTTKPQTLNSKSQSNSNFKFQISNSYAYVIDFNDLPEASDLWLFSKTTNLRKNLGKMTVLLTPSDDTRTWYKVDKDTHSLTIYSSRPTTVSYRLTAPRFDGERWTNENPGGSGGFELNDPDQPSLVALNQAGNVPPETFKISPVILSEAIAQSKDPLEIMRFLDSARNDIKVISDKTGDFIEEVGVFAQITVGQIKAGFIETENAIVNNMLYAKNIVANTVRVNSLFISDNLFSQKIISPVVETTDLIATGTATLATVQTNEIVPKNDDLTIDLDRPNSPNLTSQVEKGALGRLIVKGLNDKIVASIDAEGNATFAGTLSTLGDLSVAKNATISGSLTASEASLSGTLVAKEVKADNINSLTRELVNSQTDIASHSSTLAQLSTTNEQLSTDINAVQAELARIKNAPLPDPNYYQNIDTGIATNVRVGSSDPNVTGEITSPLQDLTVTGNSNLYNASVANSLTAGNIFIQNNEILSLSWELKLSALAQITLFDGSVTIAKNGNITTVGEVIAKGGIKTDTIQPTENGKDIAIKLNSQLSSLNYQSSSNSSMINENSLKNAKLKIENSEGGEVASIDASGSARFNALGFNQIATNSALIADSGLRTTDDEVIPAMQTNAEAAGQGVLPAGAPEIIIYNDKVTKDSLVYLTKTGDTGNEPLTVVKKVVGERPYFSVSSGNSQHGEIKFNWLIIN